MLFLINVLIFALPISSTHVVISGLTGSSIIYYTEKTENDHRIWFAEEMGMWMITPALAIGLTLLSHHFVKTRIFEHQNARKRVVMLLPWYITIVLWIMYTIVLLKNYFGMGNIEQTQADLMWLIGLECAFPFFVLPLSRLALLLRARTLNKSAELE
jgi:phosphate/sulfate permease